MWPSCEGAANFGFRLLRHVIRWMTDGQKLDLAYSRRPQNLRAHHILEQSSSRYLSMATHVGAFAGRPRRPAQSRLTDFVVIKPMVTTCTKRGAGSCREDRDCVPIGDFRSTCSVPESRQARPRVSNEQKKQGSLKNGHTFDDIQQLMPQTLGHTWD